MKYAPTAKGLPFSSQDLRPEVLAVYIPGVGMQLLVKKEVRFRGNDDYHAMVTITTKITIVTLPGVAVYIPGVGMQLLVKKEVRYCKEVDASGRGYGGNL